MLTGIYGNPVQKTLRFLWVGSGKGVFSTLLISKALRAEIPVYSNFKINTEHPVLKPYAKYWHYLTIDGLAEIEENNYDRVKIFVDEAVTWIESRVSAHDETNQYVDSILALSRHNNEDWVCISQLKSMLDKRFRLMSSCEIWCADRRLHNPDGSDCTDDFEYMITNKIHAVHKKLLYKKVLKLDLFSMYNTKEKILSPKFESLQFRMNEKNREKLNLIIDDYAKTVLKEIPYEFKNITQYMVKDAMLRLNLPLDYVPYVFARIKSKK